MSFEDELKQTALSVISDSDDESWYSAEELYDNEYYSIPEIDERFIALASPKNIIFLLNKIESLEKELKNRTQQDQEILYMDGYKETL